MQSSMRFLFFVCCFVLTTYCGAQSWIIESRQNAMMAKRLSPKYSRASLKSGVFTSPDGLYTVNISLSEAVAKLEVVSSHSHKVVLRKRLIEFQRFGWIPKRKHSFAIAGKVSIKESFVGFWSGGTKILHLRVLHLPQGFDADAQYLVLEYLSRDGNHILIREYDAAAKSEIEAEKQSRKLIELPLPIDKEGASGATTRARVCKTPLPPTAGRAATPTTRSIKCWP